MNCNTCFHHTINEYNRRYCSEKKLLVPVHKVTEHNNCEDWKNDQLGFIKRR